MSELDDELDAELRRLFDDERLAVRPKTDAPEAIVAGARRIRRRRTAMMSASGAVVAVVLVGGSLTFGPFRSQDNVAAMNTSVLKTGAPEQTAPGTAFPAPPTEVLHTGQSPPPASEPGVPPPGGKPTTTQNAPAKTTPTSGKREPQFITTGGLLSPTGFGSLRLDISPETEPPANVTLTDSYSSTACTGYNFSGPGVPGPGFTAASPATPYNNGGQIVKIVPSDPVHTPEGIGKGSTRDDVKQKYAGAVEDESGLHAPASATSTYRFAVDSANVVQAILLEKNDNDC